MPANLPDRKETVFLNAIIDHPIAGTALLPSAVELSLDSIARDRSRYRLLTVFGQQVLLMSCNPQEGLFLPLPKCHLRKYSKHLFPRTDVVRLVVFIYGIRLA